MMWFWRKVGWRWMCTSLMMSVREGFTKKSHSCWFSASSPARGGMTVWRLPICTVMVCMLPDDSVFCSAAVSRWRSIHVCGYFDRRASSRWASGRAEVRVLHMGQRASSPETASNGAGSESTSTMIMGASRDVEAQVAMQNLQRVWRHVVVTGSCSSIWQIGQRSSSLISSFELVSSFTPAEDVDGILSFFTLSRKERCAR